MFRRTYLALTAATVLGGTAAFGAAHSMDIVDTAADAGNFTTLLAAAEAAELVETLKGEAPTVYHNDHSRPERPVVRTLEEEIGRVVRARVVNPKWIAGVMRHGYKGAFEMAATVDYMFAFAATTGAVRDHHFEAVYQAYLMDETVRDFIADKNPDALREMAERLREAIDRGLWTPKSNSAMFALKEMSGRTL